MGVINQTDYTGSRTEPHVGLHETCRQHAWRLELLHYC
jgi:hypothetical protein